MNANSRSVIVRSGDGENATYHLVWCPGCEDVHAWRTPLWEWNGDHEKPTVSPSLLVTGGSRGLVCHSFIRDGQWQFLADSTHALAGQTVPMVPIPN